MDETILDSGSLADAETSLLLNDAGVSGSSPQHKSQGQQYQLKQQKLKLNQQKLKQPGSPGSYSGYGSFDDTPPGSANGDRDRGRAEEEEEGRDGKTDKPL
jgi:hypothetical protein